MIAFHNAYGFRIYSLHPYPKIVRVLLH